MSSSPLLSLEEHKANLTYSNLLWAMSRPGIKRQLPDQGEISIIHSLIDRECSVFATSPDVLSELNRVGARLCNIEEADHVFLGALSSLGELGEIEKGSDLYPDLGATVVLSVNFDQGPVCRFSGPGVESSVDLAIAGLPVGFWQTRSELMRYPVGFDLFLLDGSHVVGVPRSTVVEVS